ncbi:MAG: SDR family NAD(P)-dependent oxidoreductase [Gammaproteobacteria bacterium]
MSQTLAGRAAIVTGAGRGIGRATAMALARLGASVLVNDSGVASDGSDPDGTLAQAVAADIRGGGGRAIANADSVSDPMGAQRIVAAAAQSFGGVDILVNNAGLAVAGAIEDLDPALFDRVCDSHVKGTFYCMHFAVPHMRRRGWGRIVNLVSRAGIVGTPAMAAYGAGKGGVFGLTNVASRELAGSGITVNAVNPSSTDTRMVAEAIESAQRAGGEAALRAENLRRALQRPEEVAVLIASLCTEAAGRINGQILYVARREIGLFRPLALERTADRDAPWTVDELVRTLGEVDFNPLDTPYAN